MARDFADAIGLDHIPVCSRCSSPVSVTTLNVQAYLDGGKLVCSGCDRNPLDWREQQYTRKQ